MLSQETPMTAILDARILVVGATGGLGRAVSLELVSRGAVLALAARSRERLVSQSILNEVQLSLDLTVPDAPAAVVRAAHARLGRLDGVVCLAGAVAFGPLAGTPRSVVEEIVALDLTLPLLLAQAAIPLLEPDGFVANASGVVAELPTAGLVAYSAAKAGVSAGYRALAREVRSRGIAVIDIRPPHTETGLADRPLHGVAPRLPVGLDPADVARRIVDAIEAREREVVAASFTP
jgi:NAD(P)-dependent dehydrogenase (short-subunit alcohol dehydrogenase family)